MPAIEDALRRLQRHLSVINKRLRAPRDPLSDEVVQNMLVGYAHVDALVGQDVDLFAMGSHRHLLALNHLVLCGEAAATDPEFARHRLTTEERFYEELGIGDLVEWYARHAHDSPWLRAAGLYVRILSAPQLFIEGNHRTGALAMSYLLLRAGLPPFVLTPDIATSYFDPSTAIRNIHKDGIVALFQRPGMTRRFARFLAAHADPAYLLVPEGTAAVPKR